MKKNTQLSLHSLLGIVEKATGNAKMAREHVKGHGGTEVERRELDLVWGECFSGGVQWRTSKSISKLRLEGWVS